MLDHVDVNGDAVDGRAAVFGWMCEQMAAAACRQRQAHRVHHGRRGGAVGNEGCVSRGCPDDRHPGPAARHTAIVGCRDAVSFERKSAAEKFVRERVMRILHGEVDGVVRGLRRMGTVQGFRGDKADQVGEDLRILRKEPRSYAL